MSERNHFIAREFLSDSEGCACGFFDLYVKLDNNRVDTRFRVSDCNNICNLDFDCYNSKKEADRLRAKVRRLRNAVVAWTKAYEAALDEAYESMDRE